MRPLFTTVLVLLSILIGYAQAPQLVKVMKSSPNVQAMQKYGDIPVSPYTGVPDINLPLYTIQYRDITVPISISYHASGIKVAEEASQVGLGWVLNTGGLISRNIIGEDDWQSNLYFNGGINNLPDLSNTKGVTVPAQYGCSLACYDKAGPQTFWNLDMTSYLNDYNPPFDFEPDQYYYNFQNQSGKFILKRTKEAVLQKQEKIQITPLSDTAWQITDTRGFIYDFGLPERSNKPNETETHITAWHLKKITSPAGNSVFFNYTVLPTTYIIPTGSWSETREDYTYPQTINANYSGGQVIQQIHRESPQSGWNTGNNYSTVILSSIDFTTGFVQFNYSTDRTDIVNDRKLASVSVYSKDYSGNSSSSPIKTINFSYDYFTGTRDDETGGNGASAAISKRLKLTQIQETGSYNGQSITEQPYVFHYYEDVLNQLPAKTSFARDHWGYYNGKTYRSSLVPSYQLASSIDNIDNAIGIMGTERNSDPNYVQGFSLQSISYPTGGSTEFQYECNTFDEQRSEVNDQTASTNSYSFLSQSAYISYNYNSGNTWIPANQVDMTNEYTDPTTHTPLPIELQVTYRLTAAMVEGASLTFTIKNSRGASVIGPVDIRDFTACANGNTSGCLIYNSSTYTLSNNYFLNPGQYYVEVNVGSQYQSVLANMHFTFTWQTQVNSSNNASGTGVTFSYGGGLRIKRIIDHDAINLANDKVTKYIYHYFKDKNNDGTLEEYSYGRRMSAPIYSYFKVTNEQMTVHAGSGGTFITSQGGVLHLMRSADSNIPLNGSAGGSPVGYDTVTVVSGENGENGKSVDVYHNMPDIIQAFTDVQYNKLLKPPFSAAIPDLLNGSLLSKTDYKNVSGNFTPINQVSNQYYTSQGLNGNIENIVYGVQSVPVPTNSYDNDAGGFTGTRLTACNRYELSYHTLNSEWTNLTSTDVKLYNPSDATQFAETITNYTYDNTTLLPSVTQTNNSKGELITINTTYPLNYTTGTATDAFTLGIKNLQNKHIINAPVETYKQKSNSDHSNPRTIGSVLTSYNSTVPAPSAIYQTQSATPITSFVPASINASGLMKDANYTANPFISFDSYDANGNLLQQHKVNDINKSYLWDYNSSLPIAEITNASNNQISYTSFEADGAGKWAFNSAGISSLNGSITGTKAYILSSNNTISRTGLTTGNYSVSYWMKSGSGSVSVNGIAGTALTTKNGWTLYSHTFSNLNSISISGTATIDEVRLYPKGAQMTTYTYEPLIGMTSQCDAANHITYYEYDGLQRLKLIRDQDNNIIKKYDYQYGKDICANGVSMMYTNTTTATNITVTFTNTSTNGQSTFTLPAGGPDNQLPLPLGDLCPGTYNVTVSNPNAYFYNFTICGSVMTNLQGTNTFYNYQVGTNNCNNLTFWVYD